MIDIKQQIMKYKNETIKLQNEDILPRDNKFLVNIEKLSKLLKFQYNLDNEDRIISLMSDEDLPNIRKKKRLNKWKDINSQTTEDLTAHNIYPEKQAISNPVLYFDARQSFSKERGSETAVNLNSVTYTYDLKHSIDVYLYQKNIHNIFWNIRKEFDYKHKLAPTSLEFGNVSSVNTPIFTSYSGRGLVFTNDNNTNINFDNINIEDSAPVGWDIELYRNGLLINFTTVDESNKYFFKNVPLIYGNNELLIKMHGPNGEYREKIENIKIDGKMISKGTLKYAFSANQDENFIYNIQNKRFHRNDTLFSMSTNYGITNNFSNNLNIAKDQDIVGVNNNITTNIIPNNITSVGFTAKTNRDIDLMIKSLGEIQSYRWRFSHNEKVRRFRTDRRENRISKTTEFSIDKNLYLFNRNISTSQYVRRHKNPDFYKLAYGNRISFNINKIGITNTNEISNHEAVGILTLSRKLDNALISYNYDHGNLRALRLQKRHKINEKNILSITASKDFINKDESINISNTYLHNKFRFSTSIEYSKRQKFTISAGISFGLTKMPNKDWTMTHKNLTGLYSYSHKRFLDNNHDDIYNKGDTLLDDDIDYDFKSHLYKERVITKKPDKHHSHNFIGMSNHEPKLRFKNLYQGDNEMTTSHDIHVLHGQKGMTQTYYIPVIHYNEINGSLDLSNLGPQYEDLCYDGIKISLIKHNKEVSVAQANGCDGYFNFQKVKPGSYHITYENKYIRCRSSQVRIKKQKNNYIDTMMKCKKIAA